MVNAEDKKWLTGLEKDMDWWEAEAVREQARLLIAKVRELDAKVYTIDEKDMMIENAAFRMAELDSHYHMEVERRMELEAEVERLRKAAQEVIAIFGLYNVDDRTYDTLVGVMCELDAALKGEKQEED